MKKRYDYVIVGGGSAGSALANRLSADASASVLVLEAGRADFIIDPLVHMPAALMFPSGNPLYDWAYETDPEPFMGGRRVKHTRGKLLGGSSSINGMIFQHGNPGDYDRWAAAPGMQEWDFAHCLPYFKRMETRLGGANAWRGGSGPLHLERGPATSPLFQAFFEATVQAGYPRTDDVNGYRQEGFAPFDQNINHGSRWSAARAYLRPVRGRRNLDVTTLAYVTGLTWRGTRVTGVDFHRMNRTHHVDAGEVILCGGAFHSPRLLELSGVGDPQVLRAAGVTPRIELPGVGENLQDHLEVYLQHECLQPVSIAPWLKMWKAPWIGAQWLFLDSGVGASNHFEGGGFIRTNDEVPYPNLQFHFLPIAVRYDGARLPGAHRTDELRRPRTHPHHEPGPRRAPVHPVQLPVDRARPPRVGRGHPRRPPHPGPAGLRPVRRRRDLPRPSGRVRRGDPQLGRAGRRDRTAPVLLDQDGHGRHVRRRSRVHAGPRGRGPPRRRRVRLPDDHERQHLRAGHDGGREGRRPDHRQHAPRTRASPRLQG